MNSKKYYLGIDIGGTKCAVVIAGTEETHILDKIRFETKSDRGYKSVIKEIISSANKLLDRNGLYAADFLTCGVSCGGPLDSKKGIIMCPPNLPDWDNVPLAEIIENELHISCRICNDADACAVAEWTFGAGRGTQNMIFLTFGTGMGSGLILNGKLYSGTSGSAGEVGHIRLSDSGPAGYGKFGSFEGFCSGGGIKNLAEIMIKEYQSDTILIPGKLSAKDVADAAYKGDKLALLIYEKAGEMLGKGLSILIDIFNPEMIVIGSIYQRSGDLMIKSMEESIRKEALPGNADICRIVPAELGDDIGDFAATGVAKLYAEELYGK